MNYLERLPDDILLKILKLANEDYIPYCNKLKDHIKKKYHCDVKTLCTIYKRASISYLFVIYTGKTIYILYNTKATFNLQNKYNMSIKRLITIMNRYLKNNIDII